MTESSGPDNALASQEAEMAVGEAAEFGRFLEGDQVAEAGLNVLLVRLLLCHGIVDYRRSGGAWILEAN